MGAPLSIQTKISISAGIRSVMTTSTEQLIQKGLVAPDHLIGNHLSSLELELAVLWIDVKISFSLFLIYEQYFSNNCSSFFQGTSSSYNLSFLYLTLIMYLKMYCP